VKYAIEQRIRFIDFMLAHYEYINRQHICDFFGVSEPTATRDFALYKSLRPTNMCLDNSSKNYMKTTAFKQIYE
jgi:hypothetical protein